MSQPGLLLFRLGQPLRSITATIEPVRVSGLWSGQVVLSDDEHLLPGHALAADEAEALVLHEEVVLGPIFLEGALLLVDLTRA